MEIQGIVYLIIALIVALTLHEFAHAIVGDWLGDRTARQEGRISLNPLAHIDPVMTVLLPAMLIIFQSPVIFGAAKPVPFNPWALKWGKWGAATVAAAGPAMNLLLAAIFALLLRFATPSQDLVALLIPMISINVTFMVFNLIPFPPLDGSRIAYAAIPAIRDAFDRIEPYGFLIIFGAFFLLGGIFQPLLGAAVGAVLQLLVPGLTGLST